MSNSDKRSKASSSSPKMVPVFAQTGRSHYVREFQTVVQQQYNANNGFGGSHPSRARSYSFAYGPTGAALKHFTPEPIWNMQKYKRDDFIYCPDEVKA